MPNACMAVPLDIETVSSDPVQGCEGKHKTYLNVLHKNTKKKHRRIAQHAAGVRRQAAAAGEIRGPRQYQDARPK